MEDVTPERWLPVPAPLYEGFYEVSDLGRVRSVPRRKPNGQPVGKVLKPHTNRSGHKMVALSVDRKSKSFLVHRLVAIAFLGPPPPGHEVCHYDGDPANNMLSNLRWGTRSDNLHDAVRHGTHAWASITECPQGHEYTSENTIIGRRGNGKTFRMCRICSGVHRRQYDKRRRSKS